jgi:DNA-binding phage protein
MPLESHPRLSPQRVAELSRLARQIDRAEGEQIKQDGRQILLRHRTVVSLIAALKEARISKQLTLSEAGERSGIGKANLSRLENDPTPNPTLDTLLRYADAVGVRLRVEVGG